jgi:hypothetical protein
MVFSTQLIRGGRGVFNVDLEIVITPALPNTLFVLSIFFFHSNPTSRGSVDIREIGSIFVKDTFYILCVSLRV